MHRVKFCSPRHPCGCHAGHRPYVLRRWWSETRSCGCPWGQAVLWFLRCRALHCSAPGQHLQSSCKSLVQMEQGSLSEPGPWVHWFSWKYSSVWTGLTILACEAEEMHGSCLVGVQEETLELQRMSLSPQRCLLPSWAYRANNVQPGEFLAVLCHKPLALPVAGATRHSVGAPWNHWCSGDGEMLQSWALSCSVNRRDAGRILRHCTRCEKVCLLCWMMLPCLLHVLCTGWASFPPCSSANNFANSAQNAWGIREV